jgi:hypothetical protein
MRANLRANQCDCCGGKFGLVTRSSWGRRFCSIRCKQVYRVQQGRSTRGADFLARHAGRTLDRIKLMIQNRDWASHLPNAGS